MLCVRFSVTETGLKGLSLALGANLGSFITLNKRLAANGSHSFLFYVKFLAHVYLTSFVVLIPNEFDIIEGYWVSR